MVQKTAPHARPGDEKEKEYWWSRAVVEQESCHVRPRPGHACPKCGKGTLAYDGLFVLTCDRCGHAAESGAFS